MNHEIPQDHPRRASLVTRHLLVEGFERHIIAGAGLIAHGRGEAFDYLVGEATRDFAVKAAEAAACALLLAKHPVISVNGNAAVLVPDAIIDLAAEVNAGIEVNLFYRTKKREYAIRNLLRRHGAREILGVGKDASARIPELGSERRRVDPRGIGSADTVLVPLEDGDRTEALVKLGKTVITVDLNPMSRTAMQATITIVDNLIRAIPLLTNEVRRLRSSDRASMNRILSAYDNNTVLKEALDFMRVRLLDLGAALMETKKR